MVQLIGKPATAWIGVDVGTSCVKVAQLARRRGRLALVDAAIVERRSPWQDETLPHATARSSLEELATALSLASGCRGRRAAVTATMGACEIQLVRTETVRAQPPDQQIARALGETFLPLPRHPLFDYWPVSFPPANGRQQSYQVLGIGTEWSDQIYTDAARAGLSCQTIDGLPLALARAVAMVEAAPAREVVAALDLGTSRATFCGIHLGIPFYVRMLRDCQLSALLDTFQSALDVSADEARHLAARHGIGPQDETSEFLHELSASWLNHLVEQVQRTLGFLNTQLHGSRATRLYLFGGGGAIPGMAEQLASRCECDVRSWSPSYVADAGQGGEIPPCLLGPALALSALAWEGP